MPIFLQPLARYFQFQGRARRSEFWRFYLFYGVISVGSGMISSHLLLAAKNSSEVWLAILTASTGLLLAIPMISVTVRRLHDIDRSGWWVLMNFIPVGGIVLLIYYCREGTIGDNRFGPAEPVRLKA
jgi:uncharacterized membrane protein YhaH (DUF805 family)